MNKAGCNIGQTSWQRTTSFLCFVLLTTVGMASIALALLGESWATYYDDRALLAAQERRIETLSKLHAQQQELLANRQNPSVVERVAIGSLRYVPLQAATAEPVDLPPAWPRLKKALAATEPEIPAPSPTRWQRLARNLADQPHRRSLLMIFGSILVVISLTCFYRQR